jgi:hypothetical protein
MPLLYEYEALLGDSENFGDDKTRLYIEMPLRELMRNFFDKIKSASSGFASISYEIKDMRAAEVTRLDILVADEVQPAFSRVVSKRVVESEAEAAVEKLANIIPRQMFAMKVQGKALGRIISSRSISAFRKDVTQHMYGGDITRKMKLREKQKKGKKKMKERSKQSKANKIEQAIMLLFYKFLKEEFIVVRSAVYDDYKAGVDNLIVNKRTGEVICAIDDFHEGEHDRNKAEKTKRKAEKGGSTVHFGLGVKDGKIIRTKMENLPVFYLGISSESFEALMQSMGGDINSPLSPKEKEVFLEFVSSLQAQQQAMAELTLKPKIQANVLGLKPVLENIRLIAESTNQPKQAKAA